MSKRYLLIFVLIFGCQFLTSRILWSQDITLREGIIFGKADKVELKLDMAYPVGGNGPYPALIYIFDGDWNYWPAGRYVCLSAIRRAAERGYVAVTIDYRQTRKEEGGQAKYRFPDQVHDVKCAVRWLRINAKKYHVNPESIGAAGFCSGGHLALMLGLTRPSDGLEGSCGYAEYSSRIQAVVSSAGPTELTSLYLYTENRWMPNAIEAFIGGSPQEMAVEYKMASPVSYVYKDSPPILTIHGERDVYVPIKQAFLLDEKMKEMGASHTLIIRKNEGHIDFSADPEVFDFFDKYLKKEQ